MNELSPGLKALLELEPNDSRAVEGIRKGFAAEIRQALPALRHAATGQAGEEGVMRVVGRRFALYPQPVRSDELWNAWWADYFDVLADLPESAIEAGMAAWVRQLDAEFLPKPGALRELALKTPNRAAKALERAMQAVEAPAALPPPVAPEERATVAELMADFNAKMAAKRPPAAPGKTLPPPPVDERGVTAEMRRRMGAS